MTETT